jgi:hypothetical protein
VGVCGEEFEEADVRVGPGEEDGTAGLDRGWGVDGVGFEGHGGWMFGGVEMVVEVYGVLVCGCLECDDSLVLLV